MSVNGQQQKFMLRNIMHFHLNFPRDEYYYFWCACVQKFVYSYTRFLGDEPISLCRNMCVKVC